LSHLKIALYRRIQRCYPIDDDDDR
ncbi:Bcl-2-like protein, partial [Monkeypox virus]